MSTATCHTTDCESRDIPIEIVIPTDEETGQPIPEFRGVVCGSCGNVIDDVSEA